jgi:MFS family permease
MSTKVSIILLAIAMFVITFAVNIQTPLYSQYASMSNVGTTAVTLAFAAYVLGLMPTLLFLGGLSDRVGRRLPISIALFLAIAATFLLILYPGWGSLFVSRLLLGIGTGLATTSGTAYMTELMGEAKADKAALLVTSMTSLGFGSGALATSISLKFQGTTFTPYSYQAFIALAPILAIITLMMSKKYTRKNVSMLRLPTFPTGTWIYGMAIAIAWSTTGMIIGVIPLELERLALSDWTGMTVFLAVFVGFLSQPFARCLSNENSLRLGFILTFLGFVIIVIGVNYVSPSLILMGTALTSASSYGFIYLAALFLFSSKDPHNRARSVAGMFIYAYVGFSLPVIGSGIIADLFGNEKALEIFLFFQIIAIICSLIAWKLLARYRK